MKEYFTVILTCLSIISCKQGDQITFQGYSDFSLKSGVGFPYTTLNLKLNQSNYPFSLSFILPRVKGLNASSGIDYALLKKPTEGILENCINPNRRIDGDAQIFCEYWPYVNGGPHDSFSYQAFQGSNASVNTIVINIEWVDNANNDPYFIEGEQVETAQSNELIGFSLNAAYDIEGQSLTYKLETPPKYGTLSGCINDTSFTSNTFCQYQPSAEFIGIDRFTYHAEDSSGNRSQTPNTVLIVVSSTNEKTIRPFFAGEEQIVTLVHNSSVVITLDKAIDISGNGLEYILNEEPKNGILTDCFVVDDNDKLKCTYIPFEGFLGIDRFTYVAKDSMGRYTLTSNAVLIMVDATDSK